jgi:hypothetical protein
LELRDLLVTPLLLLVVYAAAFFVRPYVTDEVTKRYFFPALSVRILGALAVGLIYQFYYKDAGDTFAYHTYGSRIVWEAIVESPYDGFRLFFSNGEYGPGLWNAAESIWYWKDSSSFFVIQVATICDFITFSSYTGTATLFAIFSFIGAWMLFQTFYRLHQDYHTLIALSTLFVPSVIFWGSGIFKDSLTLAALGVSTYCVSKIFLEGKLKILYMVLLAIALWVIYSVKLYILLCFFPSIVIWWFAKRVARIRSHVLKILVYPFVMLVALMCAYYAVETVSKSSPQYNLGRISETARITAYDIRYGWGARTGEGSGYTLGELDGTWQSMLKLSVPAINVTLFRPYLWEVKNPLMLLSAIEALGLLIFTLYIIVRVRHRIFKYLLRADVLFCLLFALIFAFGVGVSTFNFGTLSRYKIPVLPFFLTGLVCIYSLWKSDRKLDEFESTE